MVVSGGSGNRAPMERELVEQFRKLFPPTFKGEEDPTAAMEWLEEVIKIFKLLGCTPEQQTRPSFS